MDDQKKDDPKVLYHYCSLETLSKIIGDITLRNRRKTVMTSYLQMTSYHHLNDPDESRTIFKVYENCRDAKKLDAYFKSIFDNTKTFVSCFSGARDNLTMWRSYGGDGKGVCIGFNFKKLLEVIGRFDVFKEMKESDDLKYPSDKVIVCIKEVKYVASNSPVSVFRNGNGMYVFSDLSNEAADEWIAPSSGVDLLKRAIDCWSVKFDDYEVEKEWRLIATFDEHYFQRQFLMENRKVVDGLFRLKYIFSDCMMKERLFIRLVENCIDEVILGPRCHINRNEIERYLRIHFNESVQVLESKKMYK